MPDPWVLGGLPKPPVAEKMSGGEGGMFHFEDPSLLASLL